MNLDFHYYGTYYAACEAGFHYDEAKEIAWSAQMVDELTPALAQEKNLVKLEEDNYIVTCEEIKDNIGDEISILSNEKSETLQKIRKIWVPFHFLPGNLPGEDSQLDYTDKTTWGSEQYQERNWRDFLCMCRPNSNLAAAMINDTVRKIGDNDFDGDKLNLIGIRMHVLADTWAHQCFVGSPNYWINDVSNILKETETKPNQTTPMGVTNYDITYLGHGRIGHLPDWGYAKYSYWPKWSNKTIYVNNEIRFLNAYYQMVRAMKCILEGETFKADYYEGCSNQNTNELKTAICCFSDDKGICSKWKEIDIRDSNNSEIKTPEDFKITENSEKLYTFSKTAKIHRDFVIEKVNGEFPENKPYFC